jgi:hypothetical protein
MYIQYQEAAVLPPIENIVEICKHINILIFYQVNPRLDFRFSWQQVRRPSSGMLHHVVSQKLTNISEVLTASIIRALIILIMEAISVPETWVNFYETTEHNIPENSLSPMLVTLLEFITTLYMFPIIL